MENYITAAICIVGMLICVIYICRQIYLYYLQAKNRRIEELNRRIAENTCARNEKPKERSLLQNRKIKK